MRTTLMSLMMILVAGILTAGEITVQKSGGDVSLRRGVTEEWTTVAVGDVLKPNDTIRTGITGRVVIQVRWPDAAAAARRITLPPQVIVDISDMRDLTQDELMLKLTMEKVRASSYQWKNDGLQIPNAAVVHGGNQATGSPLKEADRATGEFLLNGTRVLLDNGYYATGVIRMLEVFRMYPALGAKADNRILLAGAMEKADLKGEAMNEYGTLVLQPGLTAAQQTAIEARLKQLRR